MFCQSTGNESFLHMKVAHLDSTLLCTQLAGASEPKTTVQCVCLYRQSLHGVCISDCELSPTNNPLAGTYKHEVANETPAARRQQGMHFSLNGILSVCVAVGGQARLFKALQEQHTSCNWMYEAQI